MFCAYYAQVPSSQWVCRFIVNSYLNFVGGGAGTASLTACVCGWSSFCHFRAYTWLSSLSDRSDTFTNWSQVFFSSWWKLSVLLFYGVTVTLTVFFAVFAGDAVSFMDAVGFFLLQSFLRFAASSSAGCSAVFRLKGNNYTSGGAGCCFGL